MGRRTEHPPGAFSWVELSTTDAEAAKAFYTGLFGWEVDDTPIPGGGTYTMLRVDGAAVAALYLQMQEGAPPNWLSYVTVESADAGGAKDEKEQQEEQVEESAERGDEARDGEDRNGEDEG